MKAIRTIFRERFPAVARFQHAAGYSVSEKPKFKSLNLKQKLMKKLVLISFLIMNVTSFGQQPHPGYVRLGDLAPDFTAETTQGTVKFYEWLGNSWGILFSHPSDFTPVCTTELGAVAKLDGKFAQMNVKVIALSVDSMNLHRRWIRDINETQHTTVNYPIIADPKFEVANLYGMVHPNAMEKATVRSVFIIAPDKKVKLMLTYPASTGRNFDEILRVVESLQLTAKYSVATPANWMHGNDVIISNSVKDEDIPKKFPKGHKTIKPYLRTTPQPNL